MIRQAFNIDPWELTEDEFAERYGEVLWIKKFDIELMQKAVKNGVLEALSVAFGKSK